MRRTFHLVEHEGMDRILGSVSPSACLLDPCPAWLIRSARVGLVAWAERRVNSSLREGVLPMTLKWAVVHSLLKKVLSGAHCVM